MSQLSLLPENAPIEAARLSSKTLRLLLLMLVAVIALAGAKHWSNGQKAEVDLAYNNAQAQQQALQNQAQRLQQQIADLQSAGGAAGVDTAKALIKSRINWKKVFLALINSTEEGITITSVQANSPQAQPSSTTPAPTVTTADVTINGSTKSRAQLEALIKRLRAQTEAFSEVKLRKANQREEGEATEYALELSLKPAGPLPASTADPTTAGAAATPAPAPAPSSGGGS